MRFFLPVITILTLWSLRVEGTPHVLFIAIDDLNDYISPLDNHPGVQTPHFERLARRSVNFANQQAVVYPYLGKVRRAKFAFIKAF